MADDNRNSNLPDDASQIQTPSIQKYANLSDALQAVFMNAHGTEIICLSKMHTQLKKAWKKHREYLLTKEIDEDRKAEQN